MELSASVEIKKSPEMVWKAVTDFENCSNYIQSIIKVEVLNKPVDTLIGLKWIETRVLFGKEATETMWITDYAENEYYQTRAESHGSIYKSRISTEPVGENTRLTMAFNTEPLSIGAKLFSFCLGFMIKGTMKKALTKDLNDIKTHVESI